VKFRRSSEFRHYFALGDSISTDDYPGEHRGAASLFYRQLKKRFPKIHFHMHALDGATSIDLLHRQLPHLAAVSGKSIFTITIGGNDILQGETPEEIISRIQTVVNQVLRKYPDCIVILGTIYDPTDGRGDLFGEERSLEKELQYLAQVNEAIHNLVSDRVRIADIYRAFFGHGKKDSWYMLDIEPNVRGAEEVCKLFVAAL